MSRLDWRRDGANWPNADASRFVSAGGLTWHVQTMGQGPVVLLLHGTGASTHSWRALAPLLARDCTVVAPDLPGHGFSGSLSAATLPDMATAVGTLVDALRLSPTLVVGHSAGAAIGARYLIDGDDQAGLVALGGALLPFPGAAAALFPTMAKLLFANPFVPELFAAGARYGGGIERFLKRSTGSTIEPEGVALYARLFADSRHVAGALGMMANWDLVPLARDLDRLPGPLTLLHGGRDTAVPSSVATAVAARVPGAEVEIFPSLGHLLHEEAPDLIAARIVGLAGRSQEAA